MPSFSFIIVTIVLLCLYLSVLPQVILFCSADDSTVGLNVSQIKYNYIPGGNDDEFHFLVGMSSLLPSPSEQLPIKIGGYELNIYIKCAKSFKGIRHASSKSDTHYNFRVAHSKKYTNKKSEKIVGYTMNPDENYIKPTNVTSSTTNFLKLVVLKEDILYGKSEHELQVYVNIGRSVLSSNKGKKIVNV